MSLLPSSFPIRVCFMGDHESYPYNRQLHPWSMTCSVKAVMKCDDDDDYDGFFFVCYVHAYISVRVSLLRTD